MGLTAQPQADQIIQVSPGQGRDPMVNMPVSDPPRIASGLSPDPFPLPPRVLAVFWCFRRGLQWIYPGHNLNPQP